VISRAARVTWVAGAAWVWSWSTMVREITVWHHVTPRLTFNPPHTDGPEPRPGRPLLFLYAVCVIAPPITVAGALVHQRSYPGRQ
jgi:hypothetical protein